MLNQTNSAARFQFTSDFDGDLYLFSSNLAEPDYQQRWQVIVVLADGSRREASRSEVGSCVVRDLPPGLLPS